MGKYKNFKRHFVSLLEELQGVIAESEGDQRPHMRMIAATLEGVYRALLEFDGDAVPASELLPKEKPKKSKAPAKQLHGNFKLVKLSQDEYKKLIDDYGEKATANYIAKLEMYIGSKGDKYKSHYMTLLSWLTRDGVHKLIEQRTDKATGFDARVLRQFMEG